jgi:hypothetical protein
MFNLVLTNGKEDLTLTFAIRDTDIAKKWFEEIKPHYPLYETDRFTNWGSHDLINQLNKHIDVVNQYENIIDRKVDENTSQDDLNYLHKFFEDLRGEVTESTPWFDSAPPEVQHSVQRFNILIHNLETEMRDKNHPTVVVTFKDRPRHPLTKDDMKHFTYRWNSGTVYINYCHVGKTVLDVFKDKDKIADAVRPQTHYSADFTIKFGRTTPYYYYVLRKALISSWLPFQRFKFKNPNIGLIPVADIVTTVSHDTLKKYNRVKDVYAINN